LEKRQTLDGVVKILFHNVVVNFKDLNILMYDCASEKHSTLLDKNFT